MIDPTSWLILGADASSRNLVSILLQSHAYLINYELFLTTRDFSGISKKGVLWFDKS